MTPPGPVSIRIQTGDAAGGFYSPPPSQLIFQYHNYDPFDEQATSQAGVRCLFYPFGGPSLPGEANLGVVSVSLSPDRQTLTGTFTQAPNNLSVDFTVTRVYSFQVRPSTPGAAFRLSL